MARLFEILACGLALLQSITLYSPLSCPDGLGMMTRANLTSTQVQRELGTLLLNSSAIFGPSNSQWASLTEKWQQYKPPHFTVSVQIGAESDIPTIVCNLHCLIG